LRNFHVYLLQLAGKRQVRTGLVWCLYNSDHHFILVPMRRRVSISYEEAAAICGRAPTRLSKLLSIDSAEIFGQGHTTRPF
jgi:hypothetical protein